MKKYLFIKHVAVLLIMVASIRVFAFNQITYTASYDYNKMSISTDTLGGATYIIVSYDDLFNDGSPGKPSLPMDFIKFSVPYNAKNFSITAIVSDSITQSINYPVIPIQDYLPFNDTIETNITLPDSSVYCIGSCYPNNKAWVENDGFFEGENRIVTVGIMPINYMNSISGKKLKIFQNIVLTLQYEIELSGNLNEYPIVRRNLPKREEGYRLAESLVVNPNDVVNNSLRDIPIESLGSNYFASFPVASFGNYTSNESTIDYPMYNYLILAQDSLKASLKRIAAFKRQKGYNVGIVTVEDIIKNDDSPWYYNVGTKIAINDYAGIIREYLKYAYCIGYLDYVLLAGKDVPFKMGWHNQIPTDQYYVDLSSDWQYTNRDSESELFVGRILAKSKTQIENYTDKTFRYELNPGNGDYSYLRRALYTNGVDQYVDRSYTDIIRTWTDSIFSDVTVMEEDRLNHTPSGTDIIDEINNTQYGFLSFNDHGAPMGIIVYGRGGSNPQPYYWLWALENIHAPQETTCHVNDDHSSGNGLDNMNNKYYPNICFSTSCSVMPYILQCPPYSPETVSFAESFTTGKDYGGPAFLGNTVENSFDAAILQSKVARILHQETNKLGMALALAKSHSLNALNNEIHNLSGDPDLEVWTDIPQIYSNINVSRTNRSISISGIDSDSTIVTILSNDGICLNDTISGSLMTYYASPNSSIMLHKKNHIPYLAPLLLQNYQLNSSQFVIASKVIAGNHIDLNRTRGDVIVSNGTEYEIEASEFVRLEDGFRVEKGAQFAVYPSPLR